MLNAKIETEQVENIHSIPVFVKQFKGMDIIPEGYDIYIVSALFASAYNKAGGGMALFTVADPVYTEDGNSFIGCRGICPTF